MRKDTTGEGYIYDMFEYGLKNYDYGFTGCVDEAVRALGVSEEMLKENPAMKRALEKACKSVMGFDY